MTRAPDDGNEPPGQDHWQDPDEPGRPFIEQLGEHRGFLLGTLVLALFIGMIFVAPRTLSGRQPGGSTTASPSFGVPYFGLDPAFAYDPARHQVVLLNHLGETWIWSRRGWTMARPIVSPRGRIDAAMAWDPKLGAVLMFGGWVGPDDLPRDTWAWNGSSWREVGDGTGAPPGGPAGMAYDPDRRQMVLLTFAGSGPTATTETWIWDGARWRQRPQQGGPAGPALPTAFDTRSRAVLFAGERCTPTGCKSETWSWDGSAWHRVGPMHEPGASAHMTLVHDPVSGKLLLLSVAAGPQGVPSPTETWSWDGLDWTRLGPVGRPGNVVFAVGAGNDDGGAVWAYEDVTPSLGATRIDAAWAWTGSKWVDSVDATLSSEGHERWLIESLQR